ncbi:6-phosphofructokinase [Thauera sinica]|uniref:Pyrophosphate--fructose 6-phosphate 1-phosphotransferase n=1 Tax=Thauera sinica TaxID=2665146 RepID=A0ABW1AWC4_9RHOO|nr:6-phosphofructokinase [Thauera sp. K11]ATE60581.1 6-phosphofructokinase [Thauera sp. K11]
MNLLYAQSGGVTAVINATASAVIAAAREHPERIGTVFAARGGILGALAEDLIDTRALDEEDLARLARTPGGAFGSCRFDLPDEAANPRLYDRLFAVLAAHGIGGVLYNGGNGSMDLVVRLSAAARRRGYALVTVGVPKTVDNDIVGTDCCPGFGSAAKYLATSMREAGLDIASMAGRKGSVFVLEVMGRNTGWLAAATALAAGDDPDMPPHIVLVPEVPFIEEDFLARVRDVVERLGYCTVTVSEGIRGPDGIILMEKSHDEAGHVQLGGAGLAVARMINGRLGYKFHWAIPDYLQRAAAHWVSATDHAQAMALGRAAVAYVLDGRDGMMPAVRRLADEPYSWDVVPVGAAAIANLERSLPAGFIAADGLHVTAAARHYLQPLIEGELPVATVGGLPDHRPLRVPLTGKRLPPWEA